METINGRNRHWAVSPWGHFGFLALADGRGYAEFLAGFFGERQQGSKTIGWLRKRLCIIMRVRPRIAPDDRELRAPNESAGGILQDGAGPCMSGLIDTLIESRSRSIARGISASITTIMV